MEILVVDDDPAVLRSLHRALALAGYRVQTADGGASALDAVAVHSPDAIVLDVQMPAPDGLDVCRRLRAAGDHTPVLMLTAHSSVQDRVSGLDVGADDYLVKPFALEELLARLRALLRRTDTSEPPSTTFQFCDLTLDLTTYRANRGGREFDLTRTECGLLELLMRRASQVVPRELIFERVWGYDFGGTGNALEVYIGYLRRKTEAGGEARLIHTIRGVGYSLRES